MTKTIFALLSCITLASSGFAQEQAAPATETPATTTAAADETGDASPQHLQETLKLLLDYQHRLTQELFEDVKQGKSNDTVWGVSKNLTTIHEAILLLRSLQHLHNEGHK